MSSLTGRERSLLREVTRSVTDGRLRPGGKSIGLGHRFLLRASAVLLQVSLCVSRANRSITASDRFEGDSRQRRTRSRDDDILSYIRPVIYGLIGGRSDAANWHRCLFLLLRVYFYRKIASVDSLATSHPIDCIHCRRAV